MGRWSRVAYLAPNFFFGENIQFALISIQARVDHKHVVSFSCTTPISCGLWSDQISPFPAPDSAAPAMRLDGSPILRGCAGLSVKTGTMGSTAQCLCYGFRCVRLPCTFLSSFLTFHSLEAAKANPDGLSQAAIIDNLDPVEAARLDKCRNIGIAVCISIVPIES